MKLTKTNLRRAILQELEGIEPFDADEVPTSSTLSPFSVDSQIDGILLNIENGSLIDAEEDIAESLSKFSLLTLISEADPLDLGGDEEEPAEEEEAAEEEPAEEEEAAEEEPGSDAELEDDVPAEPETPRINVESFTRGVLRIAMNTEKLLDVSTVVINRGLAFIEQNYGEEHVKEMKDFLDLHMSTSQDTAPAAPQGLGANPSGAGDMGGGAA